ncbi:MAG: methyltransferase domain-containing protein [Ilumatobacter sp.]|uniref:class I SAM-dependent methyltransferase n=1 Tax=Ilumatobacter sp. TaxID=1967498 RepID=UPI00262795E4|nr:methyltransferase domain-containing protein [Ilumatobacter sp.]MDJ0769455.1 methyltransferase domain-containing protein [Ilumatobacter sp.]
MIAAVQGDADRWNERYEGRSTGDPTPPQGLARIPLERGGRCLDVACGLGAQSLWAAEQGYEVVALDVSEAAITALNGAALSRGLRDRIETRVVDLDEGLPSDLAGTCDLVICQRFRDPQLYEQLVYMAKPGGTIVVTVLSQVGRDAPAGPYHARPGELVAAFAGFDTEIVRSIESDGEATLVARRT